MNPALRVEGLEAGYGATQVLRGIDFTVKRGGVTTILGANGAGKSTTLRAICGMVRRTGTILLQDRPIQALATEDIARLGLAHVMEGRGTFTGLTVEENLRLGAYANRNDRTEPQVHLSRVLAYFPILAERLGQQAGTLSGGEQQMLAISRALMSRPSMLLLDEPSFGLAPLVVKDIFGILRKINREEGVSILLVEQNASLALELADQACLLETGSVVRFGSAELLLGDDTVRRAYLGS